MGRTRAWMTGSVVIVAVAAGSGMTVGVGMAAGLGGIRGAELNLANTEGVARLEAELGSADFAVREAAQKRLAAVPREKIEELRRLVEAAADPEVKARLTARVEELQELISTDPPVMALKVKDVDTAGLAAALGKATGMPFEPLTIEGRGGGGHYTLEAEGMPFWKIYQRLHEKDPFSFIVGSNAVGVYRERAQWDRVVFHRGFAVFLQNPEPIGMENYKILMKVGWDPRIEVATLNAAHLDMLTDENGQRWTNKGPGVGGLNGRTIMERQYLIVEAPAGAGKTLTVAGTWPVQIAEEWKTVEIVDFTKPPAGRLVFGNNEFTVNRLELADAEGKQTLKMSLTRELVNGKPLVPDPRAMIRSSIVYKEPQMEMKLLDGDGKLLVTRLMAGDEGLGAGETVTGKVAKMVLRYPVKLRKYEVPFEFREVGR